MDEVEELIEQLKGWVGVDARINAIERFGEIKDKRAVPTLIRRLEDQYEEVQRKAAIALGHIGDASAVPALIRALKDKGVGVGLDAAIVLGKIGEPAIPALFEALKDEDKDARWRAALALVSNVGKCRTIEELEKVEKRFEQESAVLRKKHTGKGELIDAQIEIAKLISTITERKDELTPKRDLLLTDKPKPPKKGRGVYHTTRMVRNG